MIISKVHSKDAPSYDLSHIKIELLDPDEPTLADPDESTGLLLHSAAADDPLSGDNASSTPAAGRCPPPVFTVVLPEHTVSAELCASPVPGTSGPTAAPSTSGGRVRILPGRTHNCSQCPMSYRYKCELIDHVKLHAGERPFICHWCAQSFRHKTNLVRHMVVKHQYQPPETRTKQLSCPLCGQIYTRKREFDIHVREHSATSYRCAQCAESFRTKAQYRDHQRTHDVIRVEAPSAPQQLPCDQCDRVFYGKNRLATHRRTHQLERPFGCAHCPKTYKDRTSLLAHVQTHCGPTVFGCDICGKSFANKGCVRKHMRIHCADSPFRCAYCPRAFKFKHSLQLHTRTHTGERPYRCQYCAFAFKSSSNYHKHVRKMHTAEREREAGALAVAGEASAEVAKSVKGEVIEFD